MKRADRRRCHALSLERWIRLIAGTFIIASVTLSYIQSPYWLLFTLFVGLNLFQSGFTNWCPMMAILRKAGLPDAEPSARRKLAA